jgi:hypothetical protein
MPMLSFSIYKPKKEKIEFGKKIDPTGGLSDKLIPSAG